MKIGCYFFGTADIIVSVLTTIDFVYERGDWDVYLGPISLLFTSGFACLALGRALTLLERIAAKKAE